MSRIYVKWKLSNVIQVFLNVFFDKYTPFYEGILHGFAAAKCGFTLASIFVRNEKDKEEFKNDCEMFTKTAKAIDELLETTMEEREKWLKFQDVFEKALRRFWNRNCENSLEYVNNNNNNFEGIKVQ